MKWEIITNYIISLVKNNKGEKEMYKQLDIFSYVPEKQNTSSIQKKLNIGDYVGKLVLGEVVKGKITNIEGSSDNFFYRTDNGCFTADARTDFEQMEKEAEEIRKQHKIIEIDKLDKFFAVEYPPRECDGYIMRAMVGIYNGMLFWKDDYTYQFLEPVANEKELNKKYEKKVFDITHWSDKKERIHTVLDKPLSIKRLYWSKKGFYTEAPYVTHNG